ncbi:MAG TPA: hypothetical protein VJT68_04720, partial [Thermoleophilaceae bacterium]|nr:hypothetical protein [Thermoleophilaceae bacterium]
MATAGCSFGDGSSTAGRGAGVTGPSHVLQKDPPRVPRYVPLPDEEFPNGKRLAARIAQSALTYSRGTTARELARSLPRSSLGAAKFARILRPAVDPDSRSAARVIYPQLSGVTTTSLGVMVVVRQATEDQRGERRARTRVVDVRLRRSGGPWSLDAVASVGGIPPRRAGRVSPAAAAVLDSPNIALSDSARWDIRRGSVDRALLKALRKAANGRKLAIGVIRSGHPRNVWDTGRRSGHSRGAAADIYAVDGRPVIAQREVESSAYRLAAQLFAGRAYQLGSPWLFGGGGS